MKVILILLGLFLMFVGFIAIVASVVLFLMAKKRAAASAATVQPKPVQPESPTPPVAPAPVVTSGTSPAREVRPVGASDPTIVVPVPKMAYGRLKWLAGPLAGTTTEIDPEGLYIGRDAQFSDLVVAAASLSKRHVWIGLKNDEVVIVDQNSTNGTFLGKARTERLSERVLHNGDEIVLADDAARFRYDAE